MFLPVDNQWELPAVYEHNIWFDVAEIGLIVASVAGFGYVGYLHNLWDLQMGFSVFGVPLATVSLKRPDFNVTVPQKVSS